MRVTVAIIWPVERSVQRGASTAATVSDSMRIVAYYNLSMVTGSRGVDAEAALLLRKIEFLRAARIQLADSRIPVGVADEKVTRLAGSLRELTVALLIFFVVDIARNASAGQLANIRNLPAVNDWINSANGRYNRMLRKLIRTRSQPLALNDV